MLITCQSDGMQTKLFELYSLPLPVNPEKKNPKRGTVAERVFRKKIQRAALHQFVYVSVLWIFSGKHARLRSQKIAYIFVQHGICPLMLAYAI